MADEAAELFSLALKLPPEARAALADSLIGSLDEVVDEDAEEAWWQEIALRAKEIESGAVATIPWEEVRRNLRATLDR